MYKNILFSICTALILIGCSADPQPVQSTASIESARPNFLIITTDDMGYTDLGAFGGQDIPTPNLDQLAMEGVRLTNFHVNVSCAPTRSMLMSGTGNTEAGMGSQQAFPAFVGQPGYEGHISERVVTLPERMQAAGYHTYMAGKWHLGSTEGETLPGDRGFERSFALLSGGWTHFKLEAGLQLPSVGTGLAVPYTEDGQLVEDIPDDFYSTVAYTDKMLDYLKSNAGDGKPFFAWFAPTAPHWPLQVLPDWKDRFAGAFDEGYEVLCHQRQAGAKAAGVLPAGANLNICPELAQPWDELSEQDKQLNRRTMELYAAMVAHMDSEFGRILAYLRETGQLDNTYIIYHNDNGPEGGEIFDNRSNLSWVNNSLENLGNADSWVNTGQGWADAQSAPFREDKGSQFEGGIRVPAFIRAPDRAQAEGISRSFTTVMDIMPTVMQLAGITDADYPSSPDQLPIRGKSFAPLLHDVTARIHPQGESIALDHAGLSWLMEDGWKIVRRVNSDDWQLYRVSDDPNELLDLATEQPEKLADLVGKYESHAQAVGILRR